MLNKLQNIRAVLEQAVELELAGAGSALLDFKEFCTEQLNEADSSDELATIVEGFSSAGHSQEMITPLQFGAIKDGLVHG